MLRVLLFSHSSCNNDSTLVNWFNYCSFHSFHKQPESIKLIHWMMEWIFYFLTDFMERFWFRLKLRSLPQIDCHLRLLPMIKSSFYSRSAKRRIHSPKYCTYNPCILTKHSIQKIVDKTWRLEQIVVKNLVCSITDKITIFCNIIFYERIGYEKLY